MNNRGVLKLTDGSDFWFYRSSAKQYRERGVKRYSRSDGENPSGWTMYYTRTGKWVLALETWCLSNDTSEVHEASVVTEQKAVQWLAENRRRPKHVADQIDAVAASAGKQI